MTLAPPDVQHNQRHGDEDHARVVVIGGVTPTTIQPDDAAAAGSSTTAAAADHKHAIVAAVAGAIAPDDAAAEGVATSFARSDHKHSIVGAVAGNIAPDDVAAEGTATSFARSDHVHSNTAATAGTSRMNEAAAEGSATSFARSDHKHAREVYGYQRVATSQGTTSTSYTDLATSGPATTLTTGTIVKVSLGIWCGNGTNGDGCLMSVAVSGATTRAAADAEGVGITLQASANNTVKVGHTVVISGLTAGSNVFTAKYRAVTGGTATFLERFLLVEGVD